MYLVIGSENDIIYEYGNFNDLYNGTINNIIEWSSYQQNKLSTDGVVVTDKYFIFDTKYHPNTSNLSIIRISEIYRKYKIDKILK